MFAFAAILDFSCVVYETETEVFPENQSDPNRPRKTTATTLTFTEDHLITCHLLHYYNAIYLLKPQSQSIDYSNATQTGFTA